MSGQVFPFHLAIPVYDLQESREFYSKTLGLKEMRSAMNWVDFDFFGHQISLTAVRPGTDKIEKQESCLIDGDQIPVRHFGMVLPKAEWEALRDRLTEKLQKKFLIGPKVRFKGLDSEQGTFFLTDPSGNYLEFKYFSDTSQGLWH